MNFDLQKIAIYIVVLAISISLHEMMHSLVAYWLGDRTSRDRERLTLNPLAHIDPFTTIALPLILALSNLPPIGAAKPVPVDTRNLRWNEYGLALVGIAGPLTNLFLAFLGGFILKTFPVLQSGLALKFLVAWIILNISFFVFNMIPFPPLDGSRLLYAFAPESVQKVMFQIEQLGMTGILLFVLFIMPMLSNVINNIYNQILKLVL